MSDASRRPGASEPGADGGAGARGRGRRGVALGNRGRWLITAIATVASAWALELFATGAGATLVATGVLADQPRPLVLVFLAASYVVWAAGLGVNLVANGRLLEATGASSAALSKALFDAAGLRSATPFVQRTAASVGYVATEIAKEVPYYLGAFGASAASDGFGALDTLVFLGGANVGAGIYEFGIARLTGAYLVRRSKRRRAAPAPPAPSDSSYACFDTAWEPGDYLNDYYQDVEPDEWATIAFFVEALRRADPGEPILVFGVGPTLHHVFLAASVASEIHLAEYLPANLAEIERWLVGAPDAHDWSPFVRYTLECEGVVAPTAEQVRRREALTRVKVTELLSGDARFVDPLRGGSAPYGTVISAYCADSATSDPATWERYLSNIAGLVRPGGLFVTAALRHSTGYVVGGRTFPSASVGEADLARVLAPRFDWSDGTIEVCELPGHQAQGYASIILARVRRRAEKTPVQTPVATGVATPVAG